MADCISPRADAHPPVLPRCDWPADVVRPGLCLWATPAVRGAFLGLWPGPRPLCAGGQSELRRLAPLQGNTQVCLCNVWSAWRLGQAVHCVLRSLSWHHGLDITPYTSTPQQHNLKPRGENRRLTHDAILSRFVAHDNDPTQNTYSLLYGVCPLLVSTPLSPAYLLTWQRPYIQLGPRMTKAGRPFSTHTPSLTRRHTNIRSCQPWAAAETQASWTGAFSPSI